jgi:hypothetical protein
MTPGLEACQAGRHFSDGINFKDFDLLFAGS